MMAQLYRKDLIQTVAGLRMKIIWSIVDQFDGNCSLVEATGTKARDIRVVLPITRKSGSDRDRWQIGSQCEVYCDNIRRLSSRIEFPYCALQIRRC
jgi:hypothetical protein